MISKLAFLALSLTTVGCGETVCKAIAVTAVILRVEDLQTGALVCSANVRATRDDSMTPPFVSQPPNKTDPCVFGIGSDSGVYRIDVSADGYFSASTLAVDVEDDGGPCKVTQTEHRTIRLTRDPSSSVRPSSNDGGS